MLPPANYVVAGDVQIHASLAAFAKRPSDEAFVSKVVDDERSKLLSAYDVLVEQLHSMVAEGIRVGGDGTAWIQYWDSEDRLRQFQDLFDGIRMLEKRLNELDIVPWSDEDAQESRDQILEVFPFLDDQLSFCEHVLAQSFRCAKRMSKEPLDEANRDKDAAYAQRFNWAVCWTLVSMNTLLIAADTDEHGEPMTVTEDLISVAIAAARQFVLEANHAVREGERLRKKAEPAQIQTADSEESGEVVEDSDLADVEDTVAREEARRG